MTMTMLEAARERHTVRSYQDVPLATCITDALDARVAELNASHNTAIELRTQDTAAFGAILRLFLAKGVRNYFVLAGEDAPDLEERLGHAGADLALFSQTLDLNTWWVGGTYSRRALEKMLPGMRVHGVIAVGYGTTQGVPHKSKAAADVSSYNGEEPAWFTAGVETALLAPTAMNRQAFFLKGFERDVTASYVDGFLSGIDLGIVKYHFELGAGVENFRWV